MSNGHSSLVAGKLIDLPCEVGQGTSSFENWVKINASSKPISAFVQSKFVKRNDDKTGQVSVLVRNVEPNNILLWIFGEVLSESNPVRVNKSWISENFIKLR